MTEPYDVSWKLCSMHELGCQARVRNHRWAMIRAGEEGWMFQKNGDAWCPEHLPDWVHEWRAKNALQE